jgi:hypothetical protein
MTQMAQRMAIEQAPQTMARVMPKSQPKHQIAGGVAGRGGVIYSLHAIYHTDVHPMTPSHTLPIILTNLSPKLTHLLRRSSLVDDGFLLCQIVIDYM